MVNNIVASKPLTLDKFEPLISVPTNTLFYGTILKTDFDLTKTTISPKYNSKKFYIISQLPTGYKIFYFYGFFVKVKKEFTELINNINLFSQLPPNNHILKNYIKILNLFNLSCEESYLFFNKDVYPVDTKFKNLIFEKNIDDNCFIPNKELPFYLTLTAPYIFYFSNTKNNMVEFKNFLSNNTSVNIEV